MSYGPQSLSVCLSVCQSVCLYVRIVNPLLSKMRQDKKLIITFSRSNSRVLKFCSKSSNSVLDTN